MYKLTKRYLMLFLKFVVGLIPKQLRAKLKMNAKLTSFYTLSLQRSGLFYGFPTAKQLQAQYLSNIRHQNAIIKNLVKVDDKPLSSLIILAPNHSVKALGATLDSVVKQSIQFKSIHILCSSESPKELMGVLSQYELEVTISNALNVKQVMALVDLVFVNQGDVLHEEFHQSFRQYSNSNSQIVYSDIDYLDIKQQRNNAEFLPDWNKELLISTLYIQSAVLVKNVNQSIAKKILTLRNEEDLSLLCLWVDANTPGKVIQHIPLVLLHRTIRRKPISDAIPQKIISILNCDGLEVTLNKKTNVISAQWPLKNQPLISLIVPTRNAQKLVQECIESILSKTDYHNFEILLIDNNSDEESSVAYFQELSKHDKIRLLHYRQEFNYSAINNFAATHARGEILGLINNDIVVSEPTWLTKMAGHVLRNEVGCVGAKLLYGDGRIQHAGVVLGYGGGAGHAHKYFPQLHTGYLNRLVATQNYSAVTAACLLVKKSDFDSVGGLDEENLTIAFNDVDFCLKIAELGKSNVFCAEAILYHLESVSRGVEDTAEKVARFESEIGFLKTKWKRYIMHDPAYNPNLTLKRENFAIASESEYKERQEWV